MGESVPRDPRKFAGPSGTDSKSHLRDKSPEG